MAPARKRILYVATEDWYFRSHYLPLARAAVAAGFEVTVAARLGAAAPALAEAGIAVLPVTLARGTLNPFSLPREVAALARLIRRVRPDILHLVALKPILVGGLAALAAPVPAIVNAVTGQGFLAVGDSARVALARRAAWLLIGALLARGNSWAVVQNEHDARLLARKSRNPVTRIGGAGVDPGHYAELPPPDGARVTAATVSRMLWSKGIDTLVEAQRLLRRRGVALDVTLAGPVEEGIPNALPRATIEAWARAPGVAWAGRQEDVREVWRNAAIAVLASRGGEGLPRALIEAASCGRPIVTTDVPGCRDLVRDGIEGFVVTPGDAGALAAALEKLAADEGLRRRMGRAARARVLDGFTERQVCDAVIALYRRIAYSVASGTT